MYAALDYVDVISIIFISWCE